MVALKPRDIAVHLKNRPGHIWLYLVYGADETLVRERARTLGARIVADLNDPFSTIDIAESSLKATPTVLVDEAGALSFTGGLRLVRLRLSGESAPPPVRGLIEHLDQQTGTTNAVTIIEAGSLSKRSSLRKLVENAGSAAAVPCYDDSLRDTGALIDKALLDAGFRLERAAKALLTERLTLIAGGNRGFIRQEVEKLILYMGPVRTGSTQMGLTQMGPAQAGPARTGSLPTPDAPPAPITAEDINACLSYGQSDATGILPDLILRGQTASLSKALAQAREAGANEIACLRAIYRVFARAYMAQNFMREGMSQSAAMKKLRPPVFFAEEQKYRACLSTWDIASLERALARLTEAESLVKSTGKPAREIMERTALQLAVLGARLIARNA